MQKQPQYLLAGSLFLTHLPFKLNRRGALSLSFFAFTFRAIIAVQPVPSWTQNALSGLFTLIV